MDSNINIPLETYVNSTYKTFKEAERTYYKSKNKLMVVIYILVTFMIICSLLLLMLGSDVTTSITFLVISVLYLPGIYLIRLLLIKKMYKTNVALHDSTIHYIFYDEYFELSTPLTQSKVKYEAIYSTIEGDNYILLLPSAKKFFIVDKRNCSEELINFLHIKMEEINTRNSKK